MTNLSIFDFNSNDVRVLSINGEPWFVAKDVLAAIRSTTTVTALETLIREELGDEFVTNKVVSDNLGRGNEMLVLSESALTMFVSRSRTELGKRMNRWIHVEVLPSIRAYGRYDIDERGTGRVEFPDPQPRQLPPVRDVVDYMEALKFAPTITNPILKAAFEQRLAEELGATNALPPARECRPVLASVLARELGYTLNPGDDAKLGKWVRKHHEPIGRCQHGRYEVNVYDRHRIEETVNAFFR